jgi:hypothetical protein
MSIHKLFNKQLISPEYRSTTCMRIGQHEAGHYIAARLSGFKPGAISVTITDLYDGHNASSEAITACALSDKQSIIDFLNRRVIVLYSGVLAESLVDGIVVEKIAHESLTSKGGIRDQDKAKELLQLLRNIEYPEAVGDSVIQAGLTTINKKLWDKATILVQEEHVIIEGISKRLISEIKYTNTTCKLSESEIDNMPAIKQRLANVH